MTSRSAQRRARQLAENERPGVVIGYATGGQPEALFVQSLMNTVLQDPEYRVIDYGGHISMISGPRVAHARCEVIEHFLNSPEFGRADWLWMVDDDMTWESNALPTLLEAADPDKRPIVGGLCFAGGVASHPFPTLYRFTDERGGLETIFDYPDDTVVHIDATGAACLLIHRKVLLAMRRAFGQTHKGDPNPYPWFTEGMVNQKGSGIGEDIAFCMRAKMLGIPIHVHTGVKVGHVKKAVVDEATFLEWEAAHRPVTARQIKRGTLSLDDIREREAG